MEAKTWEDKEATTVNEHGAHQGIVRGRFDLVPQDGLKKAAIVMEEGIKRHPGHETWRKISRRDHLNHALAHINSFLLGNKDEDHLAHALCRLLMANSVLIDDANVVRKVANTMTNKDINEVIKQAAKHPASVDGFPNIPGHINRPDYK